MSESGQTTVSRPTGVDALVVAVRSVVTAHSDWKETARLVAEALRATCRPRTC
jgi:hypothetical protein